jgi:hypothetical protein
MSEWKPLCTTCAFPAEHVYTTYSSASNIRLAVCVSGNLEVGVGVWGVREDGEQVNEDEAVESGG